MRLAAYLTLLLAAGLFLAAAGWLIGLYQAITAAMP